MELSPASHTAWETEDELSTPGLMRPLDMTMKRPSSSSRTPSRGSRRSSHRRSVTPPSRPSPPPMPGSDKTDKSDRATPRVDLATDENISILDPRRFTPTLHASLVGEILALKRDREDKLKAIEGLEAALQATRDEEDGIQATLVSTAKENRSLKRQLALLEGGTSSALGELARERDEAVDSAAETKKRLEGAQRRIKAHEESAERTQELWEKDKDAWEEERRKTDRKVHVLETRLKAILEEVAAFQAAAMEGQQAGLVDGEDGEERNGPDSDAGSIRSVVRDSLRFSLLNNNNNTKTNGFSLADELDGDYDSDAQTDANGRDSVMSNYRHMRNDSRASTLSRTQVHRRHHSGESLIRPGSVTRGRFQTQKQQLEGILAYGIIQEDEEPKSPLPPAQKVDYTDSAVQYSPPPSPKLAPVANNDNNSNKATPFEHRGVTALAAKWEKHHEEIGSTEANQRRKRTSIAKPMPPPIQAPPPAVAVTQKLMVSAGAQTVDIPLSPPKTPRSPDVEQPPTPRAIMVTAGTQTDTAPEPPAPAVSESEAANATLAIPSIAIHPPSSRPTTPKVHRLPQFLKDFGCQVSLSEVPMKSTGIQTEEIRIDQRLDKLPRHLHPSAITSRPTSPAVESQDQPANAEGQFTPVPARNPRRLTSTRSLNGDIPASPRASVEVEPSEERRLPSRRHRIGSMFSSGVHDGSSADELDDFADGGLSDSEFRTALSAPRAVKSPERSRSSQASAPTSPEDAMPVVRKASGSTQTPSSFKLAQSEEGSAVSKRTSLSSKTAGLRPSAMSSTVVGSSSSVSSNSKSSNMRKAAMIQNGIATHQEDTADPPFPIPTRASSRQPLFSGDEQRNRSPQRTEPWHRKGGRGTVYRTNSVRKSRSAAAVPYRNGKSNRRKGSRSPPYSPYGDGPATPTVPPLPHNAKELTTPKKNERLSVSGARRGHRHQNSGATATTDATTGFQSTHSSSGQTQANGVVDAIAQTMVGEWMFKYVRRRKSFGMGADHGAHSKDDSSNDRHRRWVWLAPYERAILWSSKQPSSGSALLGKSGRKLTIQSVLDVKDDNPAPKGALTVFNRSILILTPQRALKFTAINADRHYLWLTALSFLAHSHQDVPDIPTSMPPQPQPQPQSQLPGHQLDMDLQVAPPSKFSRTRRPRIRDSIRLAKSHNPVMAQQPSQDAIPNVHRPTGGIGGAMSSQQQQQHHHHHHHHNGGGDTRTISPMPSIPDVPPSLIPGYRSVSAAAMSESNTTTTTTHSHKSSNNHASHPSNATSNFSDAAEPPAIPRFNRMEHQQQQPAPPLPSQYNPLMNANNGFHGRKRSNTGGHIPPPLSFRGFGAPLQQLSHVPTNSQSTAASGDLVYSAGGPRTTAPADGWSARTSVASYGSQSGGGNLFEAIGTMRMEAFISPLAYSRYESDGQLNYPDIMEERDGRTRAARKKTKEMRRRKSRSRSRSRTRGDNVRISRGGVAGWREEYFGYGAGHRTAGEEEYGRERRDPFEGF